MAEKESAFPEYINAVRIKELLKYEELLPVIEKALFDYSDRENGGILQPVRTVIRVRSHAGFFASMPGYSEKQNALATKLLTFYPENAKRNLPTHQATILLFDANNGLLKAILDGNVITEMRTAAASAVATKHLSSEDAKILCILGSGAQARGHLQALRLVREFTEVRVWSKTAANAKKFAEEFGATAYSSVQEAVEGADIITTVTSATAPVLFGKWVKPGAQINAVGACTHNIRELDSDVMKNSVVIVDSVESAMKEAGDILLAKATITGELGEIISGRIKVDKQKTTVFKSLGMAIEDVVSASLVYSKAHGQC